MLGWEFLHHTTPTQDVPYSLTGNKLFTLFMVNTDLRSHGWGRVVSPTVPSRTEQKPHAATQAYPHCVGQAAHATAFRILRLCPRDGQRRSALPQSYPEKCNARNPPRPPRGDRHNRPVQVYQQQYVGRNDPPRRVGKCRQRLASTGAGPASETNLS